MYTLLHHVARPSSTNSCNESHTCTHHHTHPSRLFSSTLQAPAPQPCANAAMAFS